MRLVGIGAAVCALALGACGGNTTTAPSPAKRVFRYVPERVALPAEGAELPSRFENTEPLVQASVDGLEPLWFLLDTGYDANVLDARVAARLHGERLRVTASSHVVASSGSSRAIESALALERVAIGAFDLLGVDAVVDDLTALSEAVGVELAGILGANDFGEVALTIDFPAQRVTVAREHLAPGTPNSVPLVAGESLPRVELAVCASPERLLLDTGSNEYLAVTRATADAATWASPPRPFALAWTAAGVSQRIEYGRLACDVALAGHTLARPITAVSLAYGRIGCRLLAHFRVTLDLHAALARFERDGDAPIESPPWRGDGAGYAKVGERTLVRDIVPGSPAEELGLALDDEILFHGSGLIDETGACGEPHRLAPEFDGELVCLRRGTVILHLRLPKVDLVP